MGIHRSAVGALLVLASIGAWAEENEQKRSRNWSVEVGTMVGHDSNVFGRSNTNNEPVPTATLTSFYLRGDVHKRGASGYFHGRRTSYISDAPLSDRSMGLVGAMYTGRTVQLGVDYLLMPGTEYKEDDSEEYFDLESLGVRFRVGSSRSIWVSADYAVEEWTFDPVSADQDARVHNTVLSLGIPAGRRLGLRGSYLMQVKEAQGPEYSFDAYGFAIELRASPATKMALMARYRFRARAYAAAPIATENYGREDEIEDMTLNLRVNVGRHWGVRLEDSYRSVASTKPGRSHKGVQAQAGLFLVF